MKTGRNADGDSYEIRCGNPDCTCHGLGGVGLFPGRPDTPLVVLGSGSYATEIRPSDLAHRSSFVTPARSVERRAAQILTTPGSTATPGAEATQ